MPRPRLTKPGAERCGFVADRILTFTVPENAPRLLEFLLQAMPGQKRTAVKNFLKHRQVMVGNTVTTQWDRQLVPGEAVMVNTSREFQVFSNRRMKIVYEDDDIIVVEKGYGLMSVAPDNNKKGETAYSILRDYVKRIDPRNKIFIVHRLDQQTSGLMVFAKNQQAKNALQHNWNNMVLERRYVAVVEGTVEPPSGVIDTYLAENSAHGVYSTDDPAVGKRAVTYYNTLRTRGPYSMVELQLATGRKNQIRVHMKETGHPVVGDRRYGAGPSPIHRLALHAMTLRFIHPVTRRDMNFTSPLPSSFDRLV